MNTFTEEHVGTSLQNSWRSLAIAGGIIGMIGIFAIAFPFVSGISIAYALGALLLVGGIVHGVHAFSTRGWTGSLWQLALAALGVVAGILVLANPVLGLVSLTLLLVAYLLVDGVTELWMAMRMGSESGRGWIVASGALSLVLAVLLWAGFPADATWVVGLFVGASLLATGLSMLLVAAAGRDAEPVSTPGVEPRQA